MAFWIRKDKPKNETKSKKKKAPKKAPVAKKRGCMLQRDLL